MTSTAAQNWPGPSPLSRLARRVTEPPFWLIQAMVLVVTASHVLLESHLVSIGFLEQLHSPFQHVPVVLYLVPVTFAGFIYGLEGGVLTGLWCALLASVNIALWHRSNYEWVTELVLILVVVGVGVITAILVERERRLRQEAEASNRQLTLLNDLAKASLLPWDLETSVQSALIELVKVADVESARLILWRRDGDEPVVSVSHIPEGHSAATTDAPAHQGDTGNRESPGDFREVEIETEGLRCTLQVGVAPGQEPTPGEMGFVQTVGSQLVAGIERVLLREQERELLESYVRHITQAQEEERKHIARELHDGAAQQLAILSRGLDEVAGSGAPETSSELTRLRRLATSTLDELRQFSRDLRPTLLDDLGLVPALEWLVTDIAGRTQAHAELAVQGEVRRLAPEVEVALYRITQEAMRNVDRHSGSTRVGVNVRFEAERILVSVEDNGNGFEVPSNLGTLVSTGKLGLLGMQERAQLTGGSLKLESHPESGTIVTIDIPT